MSEPYQGENRHATEPTSWHLKKEVNLSMIISIIGVAGACVTGYTDLKRDVALIQADTAVLHQEVAKQEDNLDKSIAILQAHYLRMDAKLDRLIERSK